MGVLLSGAGVVRGTVGRFRYEARLTRGPVSYGLHPGTLYKGPGRIARLLLYEAVVGAGGKVERKVASFDGGWRFGRQPHLAVIRQVVTRLDGRGH